MTFTVLWTPSAERGLAAIWNDSQDRGAISLAANTIDAMLRRNPLDCGESRNGTLRVMFVPPLGIDFDVMVEDRIVYVLQVWIIGKMM